MKRIAAIGLSLLMAAGMAAVVRADNPAHVERLLTTGACYGCDLSEADLRQSHLIGADLRAADLTGANLQETNLEGADLTGADLTGADLTNAFLTNASLENANLTNANLTEAKLYFVAVAGAILTDIDLTRAEVMGTPISVGGN